MLLFLSWQVRFWNSIGIAVETEKQGNCSLQSFRLRDAQVDNDMAESSSPVRRDDGSDVQNVVVWAIAVLIVIDVVGVACVHTDTVTQVEYAI